VERRHLEYFLAVAEAGSFTAAASQLHLAQPSLSQAVKALEQELGTEVFHRLPRGVTPTAAGAALLGPARQIIRDLQTAREAVTQVMGLTGGQLDIAMAPALTLDRLANCIGEFRRRYPAVRITIAQPEESFATRALVRTGAAELGFIDRPPDTDELKSEVIYHQELVALLPPGSTGSPRRALTWENLLELGLITGRPGTLVRDLIDRWCAEEGLDRRETGLYLVLAGAGVVVQPRPFAEFAERLGAELHPLADAPVRAISMCQRHGPLSPAARAFVDLVPRDVATGQA
jgi:DNA-binding transcriptional LysR family regulator